MNEEQPIQRIPEAPPEPELGAEPAADEAVHAADSEEKAPPLQSLQLPSVRHPVLPWITGDEVAVVNPAMRLWYLGMWREPLITALIAVVVSLAGGAVRLTFDSQLTAAQTLAAVPVIGFIVFCFSNGIPSEVRVTTDGVGVRDWREAVRGWPGRFFQKRTDAQFTMIASGTYLTAAGREPVRVRLPRFAVQRAARLSGLRLERTPSWWIWMLLSWPGLFLWWVVPPIGGVMMLLGLVVRTFSRLTSGEAEEDLLTGP